MRQTGRAAALLFVIACGFGIQRLMWSSYALPSATTVIVICDLLARRLRVPLLRREDYAIGFPIVAIGGILLYASSFDLIPYYVYGAGFSPLAPLLLAAAAIAIAPRAPGIAVIALIALATFDFHLLQSHNLFDYTIDPPLAFAAVFSCTAATLRQVSMRNVRAAWDRAFALSGRRPAADAAEPADGLLSYRTGETPEA